MINNEGKGQLLAGLRTKISLWPLFDLYGKVEEITIIDDESAEKGAELFGSEPGEGRTLEDDSAEDNEKPNSEKSSGYLMKFHSTHGVNIRMDMRQSTAKRYDSFWNALTFSQHPLKLFDISFLEVLKVEANYAGQLLFQ